MEVLISTPTTKKQESEVRQKFLSIKVLKALKALIYNVYFMSPTVLQLCVQNRLKTQLFQLSNLSHVQIDCGYAKILTIDIHYLLVLTSIKDQSMNFMHVAYKITVKFNLFIFSQYLSTVLVLVMSKLIVVTSLLKKCCKHFGWVIAR